ncbi:MAG: VCBS repeat-containing protein, partial [Burkholderiaceae bacterium]|nr:VCBS repeat-containing protein [Burkholderiaceae bacterium]
MIGAYTIATLLISATLGGVPTFDAPIEINFPNDHYPTQPAAADFDRDGQLDLVVPGRDVDGLVMIVSRNPSGGFEVSRTIDVGVQTDWAEACDLDGDGLADIALAARATFGRIIILRGHGDGTFDPPIFLATERET